MQSDQVPTFPSDHNAPAEWEVLNALIGEIYDSVLHPESWNETLARITGTLCPLSWEAAFILWESNSPSPRPGSPPGCRKSTPRFTRATTPGRAN